MSTGAWVLGLLYEKAPKAGVWHRWRLEPQNACHVGTILQCAASAAGVGAVMPFF